jgi:cytochrome c
LRSSEAAPLHLDTMAKELGMGNTMKALAITAMLVLAGCGPKDAAPESGAAPPAPAGGSDLTAFELEHGIGPVKEALTLGPVEHEMEERGEEIFEAKCSMCHKMDAVYVGPALGEVTVRRTPAFIMNMILNPQEMVERHPIAKQLLAERMTFMPNQQLSQEDARAVLEYLRTQTKGSPKS